MAGIQGKGVLPVQAGADGGLILLRSIDNSDVDILTAPAMPCSLLHCAERGNMVDGLGIQSVQCLCCESCK